MVRMDVLMPKVSTSGVPISSPQRRIPAGTATRPITGLRTAPNGEIKGEEEAQVIPPLAEVAIKATVALVQVVPMAMEVAAAEVVVMAGTTILIKDKEEEVKLAMVPKVRTPRPLLQALVSLKGSSSLDRWMEWCRKCGLAGRWVSTHNTVMHRGPGNTRLPMDRTQRILQLKPIKSWWRILKPGMLLMLLAPPPGGWSLLLCFSLLLCVFVTCLTSGFVVLVFDCLKIIVPYAGLCLLVECTSCVPSLLQPQTQIHSKVGARNPRGSTTVMM